jgi:hypothetical protein
MTERHTILLAGYIEPRNDARSMHCAAAEPATGLCQTLRCRSRQLRRP